MEDYLTLMQSVSDFAERIGLNSKDLYRRSYDPSLESTGYVISVSWKNGLDNSGILCDHRDKLDRQTRFKLKFPIVVGSETEIDAYKKRVQEADAEYFTKTIISSDGFVQPSAKFLALDPVKQVEYTLHEAFHSTPKSFFGREVKHLPIARDEEASAMIIGHLGAVHYFKGSNLEKQAVEHWHHHLELARKIKQYYEELDTIYSFRVGEDHRPIPREQKMREREETLFRAREFFKDELGTPVNNAFFIYWNYFYGEIPRILERISDLNNLDQIVERLTEAN